MKKYAIIFAKDLDYIDGNEWPDYYEDSVEFDEEWVAGKFETDEESLFWDEFIATNILPPTMWYWVIYEGQQYASGAIDPDDVDTMEDEIPQWCKIKYTLLSQSFDQEKYMRLTNEYNESQEKGE